ncbi:MAG TPA: GYD domain-containing protein [Streptosporangiaceae bacterium]|nr:GYD domain-containing protein [Streptosporangiaceae bacterium]
MKYITLIKLTDEGRKHLPESKEVLTKVYDLVATYEGKVEAIWATAGRYDFISVADFPTADAALKAHTKFLEIGFFLADSCQAFDMETFLTTV